MVAQDDGCNDIHGRTFAIVKSLLEHLPSREEQPDHTTTSHSADDGCHAFSTLPNHLSLDTSCERWRCGWRMIPLVRQIAALGSGEITSPTASAMAALRAIGASGWCCTQKSRSTTRNRIA